MYRIVTLSFITIIFICIAQASDAASDSLATTEHQEIIKTAKELRGAILKQDIEKILYHISKEGLGCTDSQISYLSVKKYLYDKDSYLFISLFDSSKFQAKCKSHYPPEYPAISDKEFFLGAKDGLIEVLPLKWGAVQVIFKSTVKGHYQREYDFKKEGTQWKLIYGLIVGNCSCG